MSAHTIHGIVLAAGQSKRMGRPKPLLDVDGETFLARAVRVLRAAGCASVSVVVSAHANDTEAAARALGVDIVRNSARGSEQIDSLRLALKAMPTEAAAAAVIPVDLPRLQVDTVGAVIDAWRAASARVARSERPTRVVAVPLHGGRRGHPVVLGRAVLPDILEHDLPAGLRTVLDWHDDDLVRVEVDDPGVVTDVDTPTQYEGVHTRGAVDAARAALTSERGGPGVTIVTIVEPASEAGRRLFLYEDGAVEGTLGDDAVDQAALTLAREVLAGGEPMTREHDRTTPGSARAGRESAGPDEDRDPGSRDDTGGERETVLLYAEAHRAPEELLVVGAGHIALPLARLGLDLGFRVTVLDDREEFARDDRFPAGVRVLRARFETDPFVDVTVGARTYIALVTRGHRWDFDCLRRVLDMTVRPRYIGMIGSRRRVRAALKALLDAGVERERLRTIHAPIGIEIGAETPFEIAISIAAELVHVRRGADVASLTHKERVLDRLLPEEDSIHG